MESLENNTAESEARESLFWEAFQRSQWVRVVTLAKQGVSPESIDIAFWKAILDLEWDSVRNLARFGVSLAQRNLAMICALQNARWDCVVELLKVGVSPENEVNTLTEVIRQKQWQHVPEILKSILYYSKQTEFALPGNFHHVLSLLKQGVNKKKFEVVAIQDSNLAEVIHTAITRKMFEVLKLVLIGVKNGRRVFKQLCLRENWHSELISLVGRLVAEGETDLAFHVAVTHGYWEQVVKLLEHVSARSRRYAFQQVRRRFAWSHVTSVVCKREICKHIRRYVFSEAIRHGCWVLVIEACLYQNWRSVFHLHRICNDEHVCRKILIHAVNQTIQDGRWDVLKSLAKRLVHDCEIDDVLVVFFESDILKEVKAWTTFVPVVNTMFTKHCPEEVLYWFQDNVHKWDRVVLTRVAKWCRANSFRNLAVFISIIGCLWHLSNKLVKKLHSSLDTRILRICIQHAVQRRKWATANNILYYATARGAQRELFEPMYVENISPLIQMCTEKNNFKGAVTVAVWTKKMDLVDEIIVSCPSQDLIIFTIKASSWVHDWRLVSSLIDRCCVVDGADFSDVLTSAVRLGEVECVAKLLKRSCPLSVTNSSNTILSQAIHCYKNREQMVRLCLGTGVSTYRGNSPLLSSFYPWDLPLMKLLYTTGALTSGQMHCMHKDSFQRMYMQTTGHRELLQYIDDMATTPRTLLDLSRLCVSHCIGCRPGRGDRVRALSVPQNIKKCILFEEVLGEKIAWWF